MFDMQPMDSLPVWPDDEMDETDLAARIMAGGVPEEAGPPRLPPGLATLEPGVELAALLSAIDVDALSGHDRVVVMAAHQRMASHHQARLYAAMASVADAVTDTLGDEAAIDPEFAADACAAEIRAALRLTRRAADNELATARAYRRHLPHVWEAFAAGRIDRRRANLIVHRTAHLSPGRAREVARRVLDRAHELTTGQISALLRKLSAEADPDDARNRYEAAVAQRRVALDAGVDGTAHLYFMDLPPDRATRIRDQIDAIARSLRRDGESRTMDQLRADVALDLLDPEHGEAASGRGAVILTVDLDTLSELTEHSGDLGGYGPVIADVARQVAEASSSGEWRFVVTDGDSRPVHVGTTSRRPTRAQRRLVETAYPRCVFPGCRTPAQRSDLDHCEPWADGGPTTTGNLTPVCRHDHDIRHRAGWSYERTADGGIVWVSPLGHRYAHPGRSP